MNINQIPTQENSRSHSTSMRKFWVAIAQAAVAGFVIAGGALVFYPPLKDVVDAKARLAEARGQLALVEAEKAAAEARLQAARNREKEAEIAQYRKNLEGARKEIQALRASHQ